MDTTEQLQLMREVLANYTNLINQYFIVEEKVRCCKDTPILRHYAQEVELYLPEEDWLYADLTDIHKNLLQDYRSFVIHQTELLKKSLGGETLINKNATTENDGGE